jgi:hypothetical protein
MEAFRLLGEFIYFKINSIDTFREILLLLGLLHTLRDSVTFAFCSLAFLYYGKSTRARTLKMWLPLRLHLLTSYTFVLKECILEKWGSKPG